MKKKLRNSTGEEKRREEKSTTLTKDRTLLLMVDIPVFRTVKDLREWRSCVGQETVGFVPTMGALHSGHISLVKESVNENDHTIISIFVNPSQFAPHEDLDSYPRTFDNDLKIIKEIEHAGRISGIFAPTVTEMYPSGITLQVENQQGAFVSVLGVSEQLEGKTRPNFFRGVATVVTKLFNVVQANRAYFGQKDIQQTIVLKRMVKDLLVPTEIVVLPIVREDTGLALSSRNTYLSTDVRRKSASIFKALQRGEEVFKDGNNNARDIISAVESELTTDLFKVDYISVADKESLRELETVTTDGAILSIACYVTEGDRSTRLIDNVIL